MTTEKYLRRMYWLYNTIQSKSEMIALERGRAVNMVAPMDSEPVQTSVKDTMCEIMSQVGDLDTEIQGYIAEYRLIKSQIDSLTGEYSPAYIYRRYGQNQSMNEVARGLHVSRTTAYRIREDALGEFEKKYGKTYKKIKSF